MKEFLKRAWQEVVWTRDYYTTLDASERRLIPRIRYVHFKLHQQEQARIKGESLTGYAKALHQVQDSCNHRKGGYANLKTGHISMGTDAGLGGFAVIKHTFAWGDTWVRCLRCGKWWKPPVRARFAYEEDYIDALIEYKEALKFPTCNTTSAALQWGNRDPALHNEWVEAVRNFMRDV